MTTTRLVRHIAAPRASVYRALVDASDVATWMVPDDMTSEVHAFEPWEGGAFRISLTYTMSTTNGKTTSQTDTFHGTFVRLVPDTEVIQRVEFETADPGMQGAMTITMTLADVEGGTELTAVHDELPPALSAADNELGWTISLSKLAALVETRAALA